MLHCNWTHAGQRSAAAAAAAAVEVRSAQSEAKLVALLSSLDEQMKQLQTQHDAAFAKLRAQRLVLCCATSAKWLITCLHSVLRQCDSSGADTTGI
jgi:acetylornithine/succinyldiaminopimelate/putrescine aminotransferase